MTEHNDEFRYENGFIISESDKKTYRYLVLENGLRVMLIHDPEDGSNAQPHKDTGGDSDLGEEDEKSEESEGESCDSEELSDAGDEENGSSQSSGRRRGAKLSAAALCIGSGSCSEGEELPGLAHYLEHMVFMGSAKYPDENDFDSFISQRGGFTNAWTDMEQTLFYFDVQQESFAESVDKFAHFFVEPLLKEDSLEREVQSVHSEFEMACTSVESQLEFFTGSLARREHPLSRFVWGNRESLWSRPRAAGLDVRARLQQFRLRHYSAPNMTLALHSRLRLDELEAIARASFAAVPDNGLPDNSLEPRPFGDRFLGKMYAVLPVKDVERLRIAWPAPPICDKRLEMPLQLLNFCLAHEGDGSIVDCLRREGLAMDLESGVGSGGLADNRACSMLEMTIRLTPAGLRQVERVLTVVHAYVGMMGAQLPELRRVQRELFSIERTAFRFREEQEPAEGAEQLSLGMQRLPRDMWLLGDRLVRRYDPELVRSYWSCLRPSNCCVVLASRSLESSCTGVTDWFAVRYGELPVAESALAAWERCVTDPDPQLLAECQLHLPPPNQFLASSFLVPPAADAYSRLGLQPAPQHPVQLKAEDPSVDRFGSLFYMKDQKFLTPRAVVHANLDSPAICESARSAALAQLWAYLVKFQLHRETYAAQEAHLSYDLLVVEPFSLLIRVEGFNDKLLVLYELILDRIVSIAAMFDAKDPRLKFDYAKEEVRKSIVNGLFTPKKFATNLRLYCLEQHRSLGSEQLACLESLSVEEVAEFHRRLLSEVSVKLYVHGNYEPEDARKYFARTVAILQPDCRVAEIRNACATLPLGRSGARVLNLKEGDVNSVLLEYFQFSCLPSLRDSVLCSLLLHIMSEPCFDFLRTKLQLGYHVLCENRQTHGTLGFLLLVVSQASQFSMRQLQDSVDKFAEHFAQLLASMSAEEFGTYANSLAELKRTEDVTMAQQAERNWQEILDGGRLFDRRSREIEQLGSVTKDDVIAFFRQAVAPDTMRSFTFHVQGAEQKELQKGEQKTFSLPLRYCAAADPGVNWTSDLPQFKASCSFRPARPITE